MPLLVDTHLSRTKVRQAAGFVMMVDRESVNHLLPTSGQGASPPDSRTREDGRCGCLSIRQTRALTLPLTLNNVRTTSEQDGEDEGMRNDDDKREDDGGDVGG